MNSKYESLKGQLKKAFARFEEVMHEKRTDIVRDSAIQRFEFTFELAWKTLKAYLEEKMGERDLYFPKETFRSAFRARLIADDPTWLDMADTRNMTSHIYNEAMAEKVYEDLPQYLPLIKKLIEELE